MYLDLHVHTNRYSACSNLDPGEMIEVATLLKLNGIVIVEHGIVWDKSEIEGLSRHPSANNLIILRGQEIRTYYDGKLAGDILVFGVDKSFPGQYSPEELIKEVHRRGGIAIAAHPYRWGVGIGNKVYNLKLDGIEILNGNTTPDEMQAAFDANKKLHLAAVGGSDAHSADAIGNYLTWFPHEITTEEQLVTAIKQKDCRPAYYEELSPGNV